METKTKFRAAVAAAALALAPLGAGAATMIDGGTTNITGTAMQNFGSNMADTGVGDAGSWTHTFTLDKAGSGTGVAQITFANFSAFVNPVLKWLDADMNVLSSANVQGVSCQFVPTQTCGVGGVSTTFDDPDTLTQNFMFSWGAGTGADAGFDLSVAITPIPLPAAGLMLLTALGGMALMRRRRELA